MKKQVRLIISGIVQGVFFRGTTQRQARSLSLNGFVRNLSDGTVEVIAEGEEAYLNRLIEWCRKGPPGARVENIQIIWKDTEDMKGFNIR